MSSEGELRPRDLAAAKLRSRRRIRAETRDRRRLWVSRLCPVLRSEPAASRPAQVACPSRFLRASATDSPRLCGRSAVTLCQVLRASVALTPRAPATKIVRIPCASTLSSSLRRSRHC
jgi:hypothetical protein